MAMFGVVREAVQLCGAAGITPFIWGHRGVGKSSLVKQICAENGMGCIDLRCSQIEASDIRGLPDRGDDGRTHYLPPADMPIGDMTIEQVAEKLGKMPKEDDLEAMRVFLDKATDLQRHYQRGVLFLDEVNRAQDDVQQAVFQLVLDRRVGLYVLPPGWYVVAAGNFLEGGYIVNGFTDAAFLDRFCHLTLSTGESTMEEWVHYMATMHEGAAADVIEFATQNTKHLDGEIPGEQGFTVQPSRRSWEMVVEVQKAKAKAHYSEESYGEVLAGLIGRELSGSFARYSCPVKPREIIKEGVRAHERALKSLSRNQLTGLMWGLVSFCKNNIEDEKIATVCLDFSSFMAAHANDKDIVVAFCRALVASGNTNDQQNKARAAVISNPKLADMVARFHKRSNNEKQSFVERLSARKDLQKILSNVSWGFEDEEQEDAKAKK